MTMTPELKERLKALAKAKRAKFRRLKDISTDELLVECDKLEEYGVSWSEGAEHCMIYSTIKYGSWDQIEALRSRLPHCYGVFWRSSDGWRANRWAVIRPVFYAPDLNRLIEGLRLDNPKRYSGSGSLISCVRTWRLYQGTETPEPDVTVREGNHTSPYGNPFTLDQERSQRLRHHSSNGFDWGYSGSGPFQLALALLLDATDNEYLALSNYQKFMYNFVTGWKNTWTVTGQEIAHWLWQRAKEKS